MHTEAFSQADVGSASGSAGKWLTWVNGNTDNGNRIQYFINNGDTNFQVQFLYAVAS
jgi:hypothetical protein